MLLSCLEFGTLGKSRGVKHKVITDGQPPTVAFTVPAQLGGPKTNETAVMLFTKNDEGRNFDFLDEVVTNGHAN